MNLAEIKTALDELSPEELAELASFVREREKLIEDLEARENAEDLAIARKALARIEAGEKTYSWEEVKKRLDAIHD